MKIQGIGVISKTEVMQILTKEGRESVESGDITTQELGEMYKLEQVKKACKIGKYHDTFAANYSRIPDGLIDTSELFDCELCRKHFNCTGSGDFDECSQNYEKYALSEATK